LSNRHRVMFLARRFVLSKQFLRRGYCASRTSGGWPGQIVTTNTGHHDTINDLHDDPDYNMEFTHMANDPLPARPMMMGIHNTALAELRTREQGNWGDLSAEEQLQLYRSFVPHSVPEMLQGDDKWKGCMGLALIFTAMVMYMSQQIYPNIHLEEPGKSGLWYMYGDGWQQHRKNAAAYNILAENRTIEGRKETRVWDYTNHCWKSPNWIRVDLSY